MLMCIKMRSILLPITILPLLLLTCQTTEAQQQTSAASEELAKLDEGRLVHFLSILKQGAMQALSYFKDVTMNMPFVLGPIIALGAMTREGTNPKDFLMMFVNFYNNIVQNMDTQATSSYLQPMSD